MSTLGERIRELRRHTGDTVREFAKKIGKSPSYVSCIETRGEVPSSELLCVIAEQLKVDAEELLKLAKRDQLLRIEQNIESKQQSALALYRKGKM